MRPLIKIMLVLVSVFASTFAMIRLLGLFTSDDVEVWLKSASLIDPKYVAIIVILLLSIDIFIFVPTLTICILSGYFLGFSIGGISAIIGLMIAGSIGYWISRSFGESLLSKVISSQEKREEAKSTFAKYGTVMLLLSRSSPIFPEVCACMSGISRMKFAKFYLVWAANSIPYALLAAYAGSISSLTNPKPAIYTAIAIYAILWSVWLIVRKLTRKV